MNNTAQGTQGNSFQHRFTPRQEIVGNKTVTLLTKLDESKQIIGFPLVKNVMWEDGNWTWVIGNYPKYSRAQWYENGDQKLIVIITKKTVIDIYDINHIDHYILTNVTSDGPLYEGRNDKISHRLNLKKEIATKLHLEFKILHHEHVANQMMREQHLELVRREEEVKKEKIAKRHAENEAKKQRILSRPILKGYSGENMERQFNGHPVVGDEWLKLDGGSYCVLVESYNDEDRTYGKPLTCFVIKRRGPEKTKLYESTFSLKETAKQKPVVKSLGVLNYVDNEDEISVVSVFASSDDVKTLQTSGLNSGTVVAVMITENEKPAFNLFRVTKDKIIGVKRPKKFIFDPAAV